MLKNFFVAATALASVMTLVNPVLAADAYVDPGYDWTGFYLGAQVGYDWLDNEVTLAPNGGAAYNTTKVNADGFIGGLNAGYNWQTNNVVFGIEGDLEFKGIDDDYNIGAPFAATTGTIESNFQGSVRGRLGYALDRTLIYGTGGVTVASFQNTFFTPPAFFDDPKSTRVGWTVGAGIEHAFLENWTTRIEYRYTDFGGHKDNLDVFLAPPGYSKDNLTEQSIRFALDYKF